MTAVDERTRIVEAYARRDNDDRYDGRRADQVMIAAARARGWGAYLRRERNELGRVLEVGCGAVHLEPGEADHAPDDAWERLHHIPRQDF